MNNFENQFNLPFDEKTEKENIKKLIADEIERIKEQGKLSELRASSLASSLNREYYDFKMNHKDLKNLILELCEEKNISLINDESIDEDSGSEEDVVLSEDNIKKKKTGIIGGSNTYKKPGKHSGAGRFLENSLPEGDRE